MDTFGGSVEVHWEPAPAVTRHGLLAYFIDFLKTSNTWTEFVDSCSLTYSSPNAPLKAEVLATIIYSSLAFDILGVACPDPGSELTVVVQT